MRSVALGIGLLLTFGCSQSAPNAVAGASPTVTCGAVSTLQLYPYRDDSGFQGFALARLGHVWFSAFGPVTSGPAHIDQGPGLVKVVIQPDPDLMSAVDLYGASCASGKALRFCYDVCDLPHQPPFAPSELATLGSDHQMVAPKHGGYTGYLLCPAAGLYRLCRRTHR